MSWLKIPALITKKHSQRYLNFLSKIPVLCQHKQAVSLRSPSKIPRGDMLTNPNSGHWTGHEHWFPE